MPWPSLFLTWWPARSSAPATTLLAMTTPCPPTPTTKRPRVVSANAALLPSRDGDDGAGRTHLRAHGATGAADRVDGDLAALVEPLVRPRDRRTADVHAQLARDARRRHDLEGVIPDLRRGLDARTVRDDDGGARTGHGLLERHVHLPELVR